jgi:hypothetical protein
MERLFSRRAPKRAGKFLPRLEALEERALLACSISTLPDGVLKIEGDAAADNVKIVDTTGLGGSVSVKCGNQTTTVNGIKEIQVFTKGGKDSVEYELHTQSNNYLGTGKTSRVVTVDLGSGDDKFASKMYGTLYKGSSMQLDVAGWAGKDTIKLVGGAIAVNDGAVLRLNGKGGDDGDNIVVSYLGDLDGTLNLYANGQDGNDKVTANVYTDLLGQGTGTVGEVGNPAQVRGGPGNDKKLQFWVRGKHLAGVFAQIHGDSGKDVGSRTVNVTPFTLESDFVKGP